ncbi:MAG: helix-turn-helix domain-containing protein [Chloroflexota bacterium]|nr:helix-turn-helix domain-containing protein [Chloroflexota bacterium]
MAEGPIETLTIAEAATLLGVHRNTVRNRVKAGRYKAYKVVTPQGETYAIERASLDLPLTTTSDNGAQAQVHDNRGNPIQADALASAAQSSQQLAVVQQLLAPFVEELSRTNAELGRVQERLGGTERERDHLRAEVERLRASQHAPVAAPELQGEAQPVNMAPDTPLSWWASWWRRLIGGGE